MKSTGSSQALLDVRAPQRLRFFTRGAKGCVTALVAGVLSCASVRAADLVWTNTAGGNWSVAANWSPNQAPSTNDTAWITNNGTYTVTVNTSITVSNLFLGGTS